jgi:hypothetical protein
MQENIKDSFWKETQDKSVLIIHWDGKIMLDIANNNGNLKFFKMCFEIFSIFPKISRALLYFLGVLARLNNFININY